VNYLLDTHILIWYFIGSKRLKRKARKIIDDCLSRGWKLLVPTIVLSEALYIAEKGKVEFNFQELYRRVRDEPAFEIVGFTPDIFAEAVNIKGVKEIHDRIITAPRIKSLWIQARLRPSEAPMGSLPASKLGLKD
jgi:PIN domain nuclease of toxin-antitoxin system